MQVEEMKHGMKNLKISWKLVVDFEYSFSE